MTARNRSKTLPVGTGQCEYLKIIRLYKEKDETDMGFETMFCDKGTVISHIRRDSAAYRNGTLKEGDIILWLERKNIQHATENEVKKILENTHELIRLVVSQTLENQTTCQLKAQLCTVGSEAQLIPNISTADEPYTFEVTYLEQLNGRHKTNEFSQEEVEDEDGEE